MNFRTQIPIQKNSNPIDYSSFVLSLGSCFADNMGAKFEYYKFHSAVNPFGILFHPLAIEKIIKRSIELEEFTENDIFFLNERWHCFDVHSALSHSDKNSFLQNLNHLLFQTKQQLQKATHLIITYGTAWVYKTKSTQLYVANCHKMPQMHFDKELLSVAIIEKSIENTLELLQKINPNLNVIFTVSPVRHIKDGFVENQRSKAHLVTALHDCIHNNDGASYFPSYEILLDELRDYRFYATDMLHPNQLAIDYIWEQFKTSYIKLAVFEVMKEVESIQKMLAHKPFDVTSESYKKMQESINKKTSKLSNLILKSF